MWNLTPWTIILTVCREHSIPFRHHFPLHRRLDPGHENLQGRRHGSRGISALSPRDRAL